MDAGRAIERLRAVLRLPTVSRDDAAHRDTDAFGRFPALIAELYPRLHDAMTRESIGLAGLLYRWRGRTDGPATVLVAHWDVVPADEDGWTHPPFEADITDEPDGARRLWARGAIDDKGALIAILEAVDHLLDTGFVPERDVYLSFGADEETGGVDALASVDLLHQRNVEVALVLDEGGAIVEGQFPGVAVPTAVIGIAEKGIATIELRAEEPGGHAAHPPRSGVTATARLARAILRVSRTRPGHLPATAFPMFAALGGSARGILGLAYRHPRLFGPVLSLALARGSDEASALLRSTRVVTRLRGAAADNVLPEIATARVNLRIVVGSSLDAEVARIRRDIADDRISVHVASGGDPPPVAPTSGPAWDRIVAALSASHPDVLAVPYAMLGATDGGRAFTRLTPAVYRFTPFELSAAEIAGLHAIDESIRLDTWLAGIGFYREVLRRS